MRALAIIGALLTLAPTAALADASSDLRALIADYERFAREADPIRAASRGDVAAGVRWQDASPAAVAARTHVLEGLSARLSAISRRCALPAASAR